VVARHWSSELEWAIHYPIAVTAGLKKEIADDIAARKRPRGMSEDQALIYDFCIAMQKDQGRTSDALFDKARKKWGDKKMVDLVGINAYYASAAMTINFGQVPLPPGSKPALR
jgi:4-carboxymuconolactone decarboxylase